MKKHPIPITINNLTFMQCGGVVKNNKKHVTVYKSLSGRVFKTIKEAAVDNYNFKNNK